MRLRKNKDLGNDWSIKDAHKKLLEHFEAIFPSWIAAKPTGILGFFETDLDKLVKEGYLEKEEVIQTTNKKKQIKRNYYRLSMKGFSELTELRTKRWNRISVIISVFALIVSILSFIFSFILR